MAAPEYITQVYDALWALLEASTAFTALVRLGDRIKIDAGKRQPYKPPSKSTVDLPEFILELGNTRDQGYTVTPTFGNVSGTCTARIKAFTQVYSFIITGESLDIVKVNQVRAEVIAAIELSGMRLGLPAFVISWGPASGTYSMDNNKQSGGSKRRQFKFDFPVNFRFALP